MDLEISEHATTRPNSNWGYVVGSLDGQCSPGLPRNDVCAGHGSNRYRYVQPSDHKRMAGSALKTSEGIEPSHEYDKPGNWSIITGNYH